MHALAEMNVGLFLPLSQPRFLAKLAGLDCDGVVFDLEDSVAAEHKDAARAALPAACASVAAHGRLAALLRVNPGPDRFALDVAAAAAAGLAWIILQASTA